jgi:hypothetical protein
VSAATLIAEQTATPTHTRLLRKVFSFPMMLAGILAVLAVLTVRSRFDDPDMWWHLKMGEVIWTSHSIPITDLFSYTTNHHAWIPHEWLSQVLIYGAYRFGGYSGLMLWLCFFSAALLVAGYALCSLYSGNAKVAFLGALIVWFFSTSGLAVRPQMIGYLLLAIELLLLYLGRTRNPRWFFLLPPLFALWVNCHGSFFLGFAVAGISLFCSFFDFRLGSLVSARWDPRYRQVLAMSLVLSAAALFLNPIGVKQILYPLDTLVNQPVSLSHVAEWLPLQINSARGAGVLGVLTCIFLLIAIRRSELFWDEFLLLAMGTWLAAGHQRMVFVFGILAAPIVSRLLSFSWENYDAKQDRPLINALFLAASLSAAFWGFPSPQYLASQAEQESPVKAVEFLKSHHLSGNMLNEYVYGGYLIWAAPEHPVFVDGRADVFDWTGVLGEFGKWATLQSDPNELLDKYQVNFCLLGRDSPMARVLPLLPGWKTVYSDNLAVIVMRTAAGSAPKSFVQ